MCHLQIGDFKLVLYICLSRTLIIMMFRGFVTGDISKAFHMIQITTKIARYIGIARNIKIAKSI